VIPGTNWERFEAKALVYLRRHEDQVALQRLRRNKPLTPDDVGRAGTHADRQRGRSGRRHRPGQRAVRGLGLFICPLVGLDRTAPVEAFGSYLDGSKFGGHHIRLVNLIITELTAHGVVEPA